MGMIMGLPLSGEQQQISLVLLNDSPLLGYSGTLHMGEFCQTIGGFAERGLLLGFRKISYLTFYTAFMEIHSPSHISKMMCHGHA